MKLLADALFLLLGAMAGGVHFAAISRDADALVRGGPALATAGRWLGRMLLTAAVLAMAALQGWPALLAATAGFLAARQVVVRRLGRAS